MLVRKSSSKKKGIGRTTNGVPLDSSLTSMDWLPKMQIGENSTPSTTSPKQPSPDSTSLPTTSSTIANIQYKVEANDVELPTSTVHVKPPYSYVTLIRQAILNGDMQRMTLNEIYQWILESYPYFRTAPPKWKNSIRHNLSLNRCFKRLQRSSDDPGKGSYWALDESDTSHSNQCSSTKTSNDILSSSPYNHQLQPNGVYSYQNPVIYGDVNSTKLLSCDDFNIDLTASFRRFREQILDAPSNSWIPSSDSPSTNSPTTNTWNYDFLPHGESNLLFDSFKLASHSEINWHDVDVKPYCDNYRTSSTLQQQDRDKVLNLASSISSFFDYTGVTNLTTNKISHEPIPFNRLPIVSNRTVLETTHNFSPLPIVVEEEAFDWDSIT
ncbi:hypothetical protein I4U23_007676 [Adineta vaga]|nr:hypothetical protein I4U23_007676 [Adineta vaga]